MRTTSTTASAPYRSAKEPRLKAIIVVETLGEGGVITVSVAPSFAVKWLVPRLDRFQEQFPNVDVRVAASNQLANFANDNVDVAIRYGSGRYPDLEVERLLPEAIFPVASPELAARLKTPADLQAMRSLGYRAFLMGERFMIEPDPGIALAGLIGSLEGAVHGSPNEGGAR